MGCSPSKSPKPGAVKCRITVKPKQFEYICTTCARDDIQSEARTMCKACKDCLCMKCLQWHSQHRGDHIDAVVGIDSIRKMGFHDQAVIPLEKCEVHAGKMLNMFCLKDGVAGCQRCIETEHISCKNVIPRSSLQIEEANYHLTLSKHNDLCSTRPNRKINVKIENDKGTCDIWGMCLLPDGGILMSDYVNKTLKLYDIKLNTIHRYGLRDRPMGICMINNTEFAVVCVGYIQFVFIQGDKKVIGGFIELNHHCRGLAYSNDTLYMSDGKANIHVYTVQGKGLRTILTNISEKREFHAESLAVNEDGSRLYLTNWKHGIVCLDVLSGKVLWKVDDTDKHWYAGICVDRNDNIYVCRRWKNDVVQFSHDGQPTGTVVNKSEGLVMPRCICIDNERNTIFVGQLLEDVVKLFYLK